MKAYGIKLQDSPKDCTAHGKFGNTNLFGCCVCGKKHTTKKSGKVKSAKARERKNNKIALWASKNTHKKIYSFASWHSAFWLAWHGCKQTDTFQNIETMLKSIYFHGLDERPPMGEELDKEFIIQINPEKGPPYCTSAFFSNGNFWKENRVGAMMFKNVVAWALMPEPSHHF